MSAVASSTAVSSTALTTTAETATGTNYRDHDLSHNGQGNKITTTTTIIAIDGGDSDGD